jgi:23S rRNA pseudouridine955/2504/2580 synthase
MGFNKQALYSCKLTLNFKTDAGILNYLNNKTFLARDVWFVKECFNKSYNDIIK